MNRFVLERIQNTTYTHEYTDVYGRPQKRVYRVVNGTFYREGTPAEVIEILESYRHSWRGAYARLELDYGDTATGQSWGEVYDTTGYIGRTMGPIKSPILLPNSRSHGGGIISTDCIVRIRLSRGKRALYQHPTYKEAANQ